MSNITTKQSVLLKGLSKKQQFPLRSYSFDFIGFSVRIAGLPIEGTRKPLRPLLEG